MPERLDYEGNVVDARSFPESLTQIRKRLEELSLSDPAIWIGVEIWRWPAVGRLATERPATTAFIERYRAYVGAYPPDAAARRRCRKYST